MPNIHELRLADLLQDTFGVPFDTYVNETTMGIAISARPSSDGRDMLHIECLLPSKTRMHVKAYPEGYSKPLFDTMAHAKTAMRLRSARHIDELYRDKRTVSFKLTVNGQDLQSSPASEWPSDWDSFEYEFSVFPLLEHESTASLLTEGFDWLIRAYRPLFDLLEISIDLEGYAEGEASSILATRYERDRRNRQLCIEARGCSCTICGFDFGGVYGPIGEGFIHVHHVVPISRLGPGYIINPAQDLIPICPNCHAMLHRFNPPMSPEELQACLKKGNYPSFNEASPNDVI